MRFLFFLLGLWLITDLTAQTTAPSLQFRLIETGYTHASEAMVFKGGKLKKKRIIHGAVFIEHPQGNLLFDSGLGENIDKEYKEEMSFAGKLVFKYKKRKSAYRTLKDSLLENSVRYIIPSHLHWDHTGGFKDFPGVEVLLQEPELDEALNHDNRIGTHFRSNITGDINWKFFIFSETPYEIFAQSFDLYNDGSLILVPIPGHTKGSVGLFVNLPSGKRYFFIGDLVWSSDALTRKRPKMALARKIVDKDSKKVQNQIDIIADWSKKNPEVIVLPAHDSAVWQKTGLWPAVVK